MINNTYNCSSNCRAIKLCLILSKLDGSAVGGTIISIIDHLKVPVLGIGIGENKSDLEEFNAKKFIDRILKN